MWYQLCRNPNEARTADYVGSVENKDDEDILLLKENIKRHNANVRQSSRKHGRRLGSLRAIRFMARGPRVSAAQADGIKYPRAYDSHLPAHHATYFDVYIGDDSSNNYELERELDLGLTPGELKRLDRLEHEAWRIKLEGKMLFI